MGFNQFLSAKISDVMVKDVVSFAPDTRMADVAMTLLQKRISGAPVTDKEGKCLGVISVVDVIGAKEKAAQTRVRLVDEFFASADLALPVMFYKESLESLGGQTSSAADQPVSNFMITDLVTVNADDTLGSAVQKMLDAQIHRVIATDANGRLEGIVSTTDILASLLWAWKKQLASEVIN